MNDQLFVFFFFPLIVTPPPGNDTRPDVFVFGPEVGDETLPIVDDGSSPEIVLNTSFVFFGYNYTRLYVSNLLLQIVRTYLLVLSESMIETIKGL